MFTYIDAYPESESGHTREGCNGGGFGGVSERGPVWRVELRTEMGRMHAAGGTGAEDGPRFYLPLLVCRRPTPPFPAGAAAERRSLANGLGSEARDPVRNLSDPPAILSGVLIVGHLS